MRYRKHGVEIILNLSAYFLSLQKVRTIRAKIIIRTIKTAEINWYFEDNMKVPSMILLLTSSPKPSVLVFSNSNEFSSTSESSSIFSHSLLVPNLTPSNRDKFEAASAMAMT